MTRHYSKEGPICPYCDYGVTADEAFFYDEDLTEFECGECEKTFDLRVSITTAWETESLTPIEGITP